MYNKAKETKQPQPAVGRNSWLGRLLWCFCICRSNHSNLEQDVKSDVLIVARTLCTAFTVIRVESTKKPNSGEVTISDGDVIQSDKEAMDEDVVYDYDSTGHC
jgi:hypothetical protein